MTRQLRMGEARRATVRPQTLRLVEAAHTRTLRRLGWVPPGDAERRKSGSETRQGARPEGGRDLDERGLGSRLDDLPGNVQKEVCSWTDALPGGRGLFGNKKNRSSRRPDAPKVLDVEREQPVRCRFLGGSRQEGIIDNAARQSKLRNSLKR